MCNLIINFSLLIEDGLRPIRTSTPVYFVPDAEKGMSSSDYADM